MGIQVATESGICKFILSQRLSTGTCSHKAWKKHAVSMKEVGFGIVLLSFYFLPSTSSTKLKVVALTNLSQKVSNYASSNSQPAAGARREHARTPQRGSSELASIWC